MVRVAVPLLALLVSSLVSLAPLRAQDPYSPALIVNESVITHYDIEQRVTLLSALGATDDLRELAIQQLTEDRVKLQAAEALGIELPEEAIDAGLQEFAEGRGLTLDQVISVLAARGIDRQAMDDFVKSGLLWREVVLARFRDRAQPSEADLDTALDLAARTPRETIRIAEIALPFEERGEAATLDLAKRLSRELQHGGNFTAAVRNYSRSGSAAQGGVLPAVPAAQLPPALRSQILLLNPGEVTEPIPIGGGLAILKLLEIGHEPPDAAIDSSDTAVRDELRQQLFTERVTRLGDGYLQELLGNALIVEP